MNHRSLKLLAGLLWLGIGLMLAIRGTGYIIDHWAEDNTWTIVFIVLGLVMGAAKGKFMLTKSAKRNIDRIDRLDGRLMPWHVFAYKFYPLIIVMIGLGFSLRWLAGRDTISWGACGAIYIGIGAALFVSSLIYFKKKVAPN